MINTRNYSLLINSLIFIIGFLSCFLGLYVLSLSNIERPLGVSFNQNLNTAPGDWIKTNQIRLTDNAIIINVPNASLSQYASTGSMKPVFDSGANGIRIIPSSAEEINVGDIVTYGSENIVHRVTEKGEDELGTWFLTKGDNNNVDDGVKVRFSDIRYVTIGVLY
jgi:hypothetical protein